MSNQSPNPEGQERVVLYRCATTNDLWIEPEEPSAFDPACCERATFQRILDDAVCVVLTRDEAQELLDWTWLGYSAYRKRELPTRGHLKNARDKLRSSLSTSGEGERGEECNCKPNPNCRVHGTTWSCGDCGREDIGPAFTTCPDCSTGEAE